MKSLKDILKESILDDEDVIMKSTDATVITSYLYSHISEERQTAITTLKNMIELYKVKSIKQMAKFNNYNGYIVEFSCNEPGKQNNNTYDMIQISYKRGSHCYTISIFGWDSGSYKPWHSADWKITKAQYNPRRNLVYELPQELTELFDKIFEERDDRIMGF